MTNHASEVKEQFHEKAVCRSGVAMFFVGVSTDTLYGDGTDFADSITKTDGYANVHRKGGSVPSVTHGWRPRDVQRCDHT